MTRPIVLLDVDGVLNALTYDLPEGWERGKFNGYQITWNPSVITRLRALHADGRVEIQWLTTWCEDADAILAEPLDLPRGLIVHSRYLRTSTYSWWKLQHAMEVAEEHPDRRIIWIDDDHGYDRVAIRWLAEVKDNVFPIQTNPYRGLTHENLDTVEKLIEESEGATI